MEDKPLGLPEGSVRAIIAISLVGTLIYLAVTATAGFESGDIKSMVAVAVGFYFGQKKNITIK